MSEIISGVSSEQLRSFIERIENLEREKTHFGELLKEVYAEAKSEGFDPKIMRQVIRIRKMKKDELAEQEELLEIYRQALGDL
jgi:uncharacterized protein (UPF0335 family)